jgi:protein-tyrosine-phosphatase
MAEGLLKQHIGNRIYVQSAGVASDRDVDGFSIAVCEEVGVELMKHTVRSFQDLEEWGEDLDGYDLIIALSPTAEAVVREQTKDAAVDVEFWSIADPTATGETRDEKLNAYRGIRDDITARIQTRFPT